MGQDKSKLAFGKVAKIILIVIIALILGAAIFTFFKIRVDAKAALRDAKNVRMALRSADIEMYGMSKTIYNPSRKNGLEEGVKEKVEKLFVPEGRYSITAYDAKEHELTGLTYRKDNYIVYFSKNGENIKWEVNYIFNVYTYDESDVITD
ncbi:MAG: hypothetical protein K6E10_03360 [Eubacterium sp.]|nr:hypothetical protein [Eubacterium sp.]